MSVMGMFRQLRYLKPGGGGLILPTDVIASAHSSSSFPTTIDTRESLFFYILAFVFIFLDLHFVGIKHYYPSLHREYLPVNAAALQAIWWALIGPVLWVLQEYALRGSDVRASFWGLDWQIRRLVLPRGRGPYGRGDRCCVALDAAALGTSGCCCLVSTLFHRPKDSL